MKAEPQAYQSQISELALNVACVETIAINSITKANKVNVAIKGKLIKEIIVYSIFGYGYKH